MEFQIPLRKKYRMAKHGGHGRPDPNGDGVKRHHRNKRNSDEKREINKQQKWLGLYINLKDNRRVWYELVH